MNRDHDREEPRDWGEPRPVARYTPRQNGEVEAIQNMGRGAVGWPYLLEWLGLARLTSTWSVNEDDETGAWRVASMQSEAVMHVRPGDYLVKFADNGLRPMGPEEFEAHYVRVP